MAAGRLTGSETPKAPARAAPSVRKREPLNNKTTRAAQRIEHPEEPTKKAKPKGRSVGGPWVRLGRRGRRG